MTTKTGAITVSIFSIVLIGGVVGYAIYAASSDGSAKKSTASTTNQVATLGQSTDTSPSQLNVSSSSGVPLGNLPGENSGQSNGQSQTTNSGTANGTSTSPSTKPSINPSTFGEYEKYKNDKNVLFGDVTIGTGKEVGKGAKVAVNYRGWLTNGSLFDQNIDPAKPFIFTIGEGKTIAGFDAGITGMKVGGERLIIIPPALGYGALTQGSIPGNSVLVFDISVLDAQ